MSMENSRKKKLKRGLGTREALDLKHTFC